MTASTFEHRKSSMTLSLRRPDGTALTNTAFRARLVKHAFLFGFGGFDALEAASGLLDPRQQASMEERLDRMMAISNYATLPFYWGRFEKEEGLPQTRQVLAGACWLAQRGIKLKGHPLCWHTVCADWLMKYDNAGILQKQLARIRRELSDFQGLIDTWDVINEVVIMPVFDRYDNAVTRLARELGQIGLVGRAFEEARRTNPGATLILNDFNTSPAYERLVADCLDAGIPIDVIGIQSHQHQGYWGRGKLEDVLGRFSRFGLPIHFTENSLVSGELMPPHIEDLNDWVVQEWPSTPAGEERQARQLSEMYSILFSHPQVQAITNWDATDGKWLHAPTGLLREDNSIKPAYEALDSLINQNFSSDIQGHTDGEGSLRLTGIRGVYELTCEGKKAGFELSGQGGEALDVIL
ncbi:MAG: endo-1,4-beta-xylanase [Christensenellales bacterium]